MNKFDKDSSPKPTTKIGFGGGCHWCTEAVFQAIRGVHKVEQGWIASASPNDEFSEAVIVHFDAREISLDLLISIHLHTHSATSDHPLRGKYRSAIYYFEADQKSVSENAISDLKEDFEQPILTKVLPFEFFNLNKEDYQNYYLKNPQSQFCMRYIHPKFKVLMEKFSEQFIGKN